MCSDREVFESKGVQIKRYHSTYICMYSTRQKYVTTFLPNCVSMVKDGMVFMSVKGFSTKDQNHPMTAEHPDTLSWCI